MEAYERMKREFARKLENNTDIDISAIIAAMDDVVSKYTVSTEDDGSDSTDVLQDYIAYCKYEKMADGTIENYQLFLGHLLHDINLPINKIRSVDLRNYLTRYQEKRNVSDVTINKYREYLCAFMGWCQREGYCERNVAANLPKIRCEKNHREALSQVELEHIRQACDDCRDQAIIEMLYSTGCRVSELCGLKRSDVNWDAKTVHLFGKGRKHRTSFLNAKAEVALRRYLESRTDDSEYLFVTKRGSHEMTPAAVQRVLRELGKSIDGLQRTITPHIFRHTTATTALRNGMPIEDIRELLGHENIETTLVYARTSVERVRMNHQRYVV